eukprot:UC1_evm7s2203
MLGFTCLLALLLLLGPGFGPQVSAGSNPFATITPRQNSLTTGGGSVGSSTTDPKPSPLAPVWRAGVLDPTKPLGGVKPVPNAQHIEVYHGETEHGTYNHAAMLDYHNGVFLLAWKNGPYNEDKSGQRILYSQSSDGLSWTPTDGTNILFPNMSTSARAAALFVGPPAHINGRRYVGASPGEPTGAAQGAQWCLWPDPLSPRNCGPPSHKQANGTLLMREVLPGGGAGGIPIRLGPIFWTQAWVPNEWRAASEKLGFKTLDQMDAQTQSDVATLSATESGLPCDKDLSLGGGGGTLKCEACEGGCQRWNDIPKSTQPYIGNERSHYRVPTDLTKKTPRGKKGAGGGGGGGDSPPVRARDVILYRSGKIPFLWASLRNGTSQHDWGAPLLTSLPNDESNLNTGPLPDKRIYLLNNAVYRPKTRTTTLSSPSSSFSTAATSEEGEDDGDGSMLSAPETLRFRDPVTISTSRDGFVFDTVASVMSCSTFPLEYNSTCTPRYPGGGKNPGPSYPQGLTVISPAPESVRGFYVVATNNKEDVWVTKLNFEDI